MERLTIRIGASFTADPIALFAPLWSDIVKQRVSFEITPPAELFQQIITAGGALQGGEGAGVFLLIRWSDLAGDTDAVAIADELASAVSNAPGHHTIILCPDEACVFQAATAQLVSALEPENNAHVISAQSVFSRYDVQQVFDKDADALAQTPYTMEAFAAISAAILRGALAQQRKPIKLIAVDCDNTLWGGVAGEDGIDGIKIEAGHFALQEALVRQAEAGRIIVLLSKNDQRDVDAIVEKRRDFLLQPDHILAKGVNWRRKSENLLEIAARFGVGEDAILFLDDNPVEIAEMKAAMPGVCSVQTPLESDALHLFTDHFWLFDTASVTTEDASRLTMYREETAREEERRGAASLQSFVDNLNLDIDIFEADEGNITRLAQLTQRTNQFNINLKRFTQPELSKWAREPSHQLFGVRVKDRFGDYGIVGVVGASTNAKHLEVSLFMLSCRALGRGVEHAMARKLGAFARTHDCDEVIFDWRDGPRNEPARNFLTKLLGDEPSALKPVDAKTLADLAYRPVEQTPVLEGKEASAVSSSENLIRKTEQPYPEVLLRSKSLEGRVRRNPANIINSAEATILRGKPYGFAPQDEDGLKSGPSSHDDSLWSRIAEELTSGAAILSALRAPVSARPALMMEFAAPASGLEAEIAGIWEDVLRIAPIGKHDAFVDLGGKSIQLVQIHSKLVRALGRQFDFTLLFEHATVAQLAARLSGRNEARLSTQGRASAMRTARAAHGARLKAARASLREAAQ